VHVQLSFAFDVTGSCNTIDYALDENTSWDQYPVSDYDWEGGGEIDAIARSRTFGVH